MHFGTSSFTHELHGVALGLEALSGRTDWWGTARIAFDAVVDGYRARVEALLVDATIGDL